MATGENKVPNKLFVATLIALLFLFLFIGVTLDHPKLYEQLFGEEDEQLIECIQRKFDNDKFTVGEDWFADKTWVSDSLSIIHYRGYLSTVSLRVNNVLVDLTEREKHSIMDVINDYNEKIALREKIEMQPLVDSLAKVNVLRQIEVRKKLINLCE